MQRRDLMGFGLALGAPLGPLSPLARPARAQPAPAPAPAAAPGVVRTHALALLGEPALPADFPHWPWVNPEAPKGGEIVRNALGSFDSFNPFILRGTPAVGVSYIWDTLLQESYDEANAEYGRLVETIELPADRRGVAFGLRASARWHDGRPVTADDVVFSFNALREHGRPFYRAYWGDVTTVAAAGPRRVEFRFSTDQNRELAQILGQLTVLPKHWYEGRDFTRPSLDIPLGSGPYRIERFDAGRSLTLKRVEDYWGRDIPVMKGTHNTDLVRFEYFRDSTVALEAFKAGQIDIRQENSAKDWATAYDFPALRRGLVKKEEIPNELPTGMQGWVLNLRRELFKDARVRQAMGFAFDFEWANANLFYGAYTRTSSYFSNSDFASRGLPEGREREILEGFRGRVPEQVFTTPFSLPRTDGSGNNREGLRRALELLREAGWTVRDRKLVNAAGQGFSFEILLNGPSFERIALPWVQQLQRLGMEVRVRTLDPAQYEVRMDAFDYDVAIDVIAQSLSPGNEQRDYFSSTKATENGSRNIAGIADPVVDALVELLIAAPDREELVARTRALDRVLLWHHYVIPNWHSRSWRLAWWDKFGRPPRNPRYALAIDSWWVEPGRLAAIEEARRAAAPAR